MKEYHKIDSVFKRDERGKFIIGDWARPEFEYLANNDWNWTEKIDGTNIRIMYNNPEPGDFTIGGKTDNAQIPPKLLKALNTLTMGWKERAGEEDIDGIFHIEGADVCLYGEGYGAGIQSGGNYSPDQKFILFDVRIGDWWLERPNVEDIANKLGIDIVPRYANWTLQEQPEARWSRPTLWQMVDYVSQYANNPDRSQIAFTDVPAEGYVGTPSTPLSNRKGERIITKIKFKDFR